MVCYPYKEGGYNMFIEVTETQYGDKVIINTNNISCIYPLANTLVMNGTHGEGNRVWHIEESGMKAIIASLDGYIKG